MIACLDVDYRGDHAVAAAVCFDGWTATASIQEVVAKVAPIAPYVPGRFFERELPCLRRILDQLVQLPKIAVVDSFVWLGDETKPGLGAHLYHAYAGRMAVVGVAKTSFTGATPVREVQRGASDRPLFVSSAGLDLDEAAAAISAMAGPYRIPTLIKRADLVCRQSQ